MLRMQLKAKPTPPLRLQSRSYAPARKNRLKSLPISAEGGLNGAARSLVPTTPAARKQRPETLLRNQAGKKIEPAFERPFTSRDQ